MDILKIKLRFNNKFSSKLVLQYGIHLGGHERLLCIETSSMVFGVRTRNLVINLNSTLVELAKILKILEGLGSARGVLYFINSTLGFRLSFKNSFQNFNRHLFFPIYFNIKSVLKNVELFLLTRRELYMYKKKFKSQKYFFMKSGKALLRKFFVVSKWPNGFISNSSTFFTFVDSILHEKIKFGKMFKTFYEKIKKFLDFYPLLPHYGFLGDNRVNSYIINEFKMTSVPCSSVVDTFSTKALFNMYGLPGNSNSIDSTLFFLVLTISNYLTGFYQHILRFFLNNKNNYNFLFLKLDFKNIFFKNFKQVGILKVLN